MFNYTITGLSWHVLCYLIFKFFYSLQNAQLFIFQLICIQLCKCLNCFLKALNKKLNQQRLNFIIFFLPKKSFKKLFGFKSSHEQGQVDSQKSRVESRVNPFLLQIKKIGFGLGIFRVGSKKFDPFCHVYLTYNNGKHQVFPKTSSSKQQMTRRR